MTREHCKKVSRLYLCLVILCTLDTTYAFIEGLYCGLDNCYQILGVTRDDDKSVFQKAYRKLARQWHPDRHHGKKAKEEASEMFKKIANAYEILKDDEQRNDYDYMLDNPDEYYSVYYRYYSRRYAPQVDVRLVIAVSITVISVIQYWSAWNNYHSALSYLVTIPKYRMQATRIAQEEGLLGDKRDKKRDKTKSKEDIRLEEESILKRVVEERIDIKGGYKKPSVVNILWLQLLLSPYYLSLYVAWWLRWIWKFTICREPYGEEEKLYLVRKYLQLSQSQFDDLEESNKLEFIDLELYIKSNFDVWKTQKDEEMRVKMAQNAKFKGYRRWMKKGGPGRMTFDED